MAATIRSCGVIGEKILIRILQTTTDQKIKLAIISILFARVKDNESPQLNTQVIGYQASQHYKIPPGTMCLYFGNLQPLSYSCSTTADGYIKPLHDQNINAPPSQS